jgi:hypothetical protein
VIPRGCEVLDIVLRKNWNGALRGHITRADGTPGPAGIKVDLIRGDTDAPGQQSELLIGFSVQTDDRGDYSFRGVAPGHYKVVLNIFTPPTAEYPFTPIYWPNAGKEANAAQVEVTEAAPSQCDFTLPPPLKSKLVTLIVLGPDGAPVKDVRVNILDRMSSWAGVAYTNSHGQVSFPAIEGLEYAVPDVFAPEGHSISVAHFSSADATEPITIHLVPR